MNVRRIQPAPITAARRFGRQPQRTRPSVARASSFDPLGGTRAPRAGGREPGGRRVARLRRASAECAPVIARIRSALQRRQMAWPKRACAAQAVGAVCRREGSHTFRITALLRLLFAKAQKRRDSV